MLCAFSKLVLGLEIVINTDKGDGVAMTRQEDDERYENGKDTPPRRSQRTKFREFDEDENEAAIREKRSSKRSHRRKTGKDDIWPDTDD
jgi:hypothetical protein